MSTAPPPAPARCLCPWLIRRPLFAGCDTVTVYDGPDARSPVLGSFSGTDMPAPLVSTGPDVFIRFQTDTGNAGFAQEAVSDDPVPAVASPVISPVKDLISHPLS